jgi:hypothetical protein
VFTSFRIIATAAAAAVVALGALPQAAHAAGSSTGSGTAALSVAAECSLTGADVDLGTFRTSQTWSAVGDALGILPFLGTFKVGSRGLEYLNYGSITCPLKTPYELNLSGTGTKFDLQAIKLVVGTQTVGLYPAIKRLGDSPVADNYSNLPGAGTVMVVGNLAGEGTGAPQSLLGSAIVGAISNGETLPLFNTLGTAGTYSDQLKYTLTF